MSDYSNIPFTCSKIDHVINYLGNLELGPDELSKDLEDCLVIMEEIREANKGLREWGSKQCDEVSEKEDEISDLESKNETLKEEIVELEGRISDLETEVENQSTRIVELEDELYNTDNPKI